LAVFVLDKRKKPPVPCSKQRARLLLTRGRALVRRHYPFTIRLNDRIEGEVRPLVKIDPSSKATGIAVVTDADGNTPAKVLCLFELSHRGRQISEALTARRAFRRRRRGANLRHMATDAPNQGNGMRLLLPDEAGQVRFLARLLYAHQERVRGFKTGEVVRADVPSGARKGVHIGRVAVRQSGAFNIGKAQHVNWKACQFIQRADGYGFTVPASPVPAFGRAAFHRRLPATVASGGF
jgi:hypothetical protein